MRRRRHGAEILFLAARFPGWHFNAVDPSSGMLETWTRTLAVTEPTLRRLQQMREAQEQDVAVPAADAVAPIMQVTEFHTPVKFFQTILTRAWFAACAAPA